MQFGGTATNNNLTNSLTNNLPNLEQSTPSMANNPLINTPMAAVLNQNLNQTLNQALNQTANPNSNILPNSAAFAPNNFNLMGLMGNAATAASPNSIPYSESFCFKIFTVKFTFQSIVHQQLVRRSHFRFCSFLLFITKS